MIYGAYSQIGLCHTLHSHFCGHSDCASRALPSMGWMVKDFYRLALQHAMGIGLEIGWNRVECQSQGLMHRDIKPENFRFKDSAATTLQDSFFTAVGSRQNWS